MARTSTVIVVGSGCTGSMAAQTLVEAGVQVTMLDVGVIANDYESLIPQKDYLAIRQSDPAQFRYLLGDNLEGIAWGKVGKGEQLTPPRKHIFAQTDTFLPFSSDTFTPAESLSYGGLGVGWGIGCWQFSATELQAAGLDPTIMKAAYQKVADRIGISATKDDAATYTIGQLKHFMPSPKLDRNHALIYENYLKRKQRLRAMGFTMGRAPLALLTKNKEGRKAYTYQNLDFYSDRGYSAWRPWITVNDLRKKKSFTYIGNTLVVRFVEKRNSVEVHCLNTQTQEPIIYSCQQLVMAPGVLSSARIALRSFEKTHMQLPLLCNPYSYILGLQPAMLGKAAEKAKSEFAQLSLFLEEPNTDFGVSMASLYSYQSLMLFRLARQSPLNFADSRIILQYCMPSLTIMGVHQPDHMDRGKYVELIKDTSSPTGDTLHIIYKPTEKEKIMRQNREKKYMRAMRVLGSLPIKRIDPGFGSSIHYAGTLPFSKQPKVFSLAPTGKLHTTKRIHVADGSGFTYLPAKGLTYSLMANAHSVASNVLEEL